VGGGAEAEAGEVDRFHERTPSCVGSALRVGVLRLRKRSASRSTYFAQDDKLSGPDFAQRDKLVKKIVKARIAQNEGN